MTTPEQNQQNIEEQNKQEQATVETAVPTGKCDTGKRILAFIIDAVLALILGLLPIIGLLLAPAYWLLRDGLTINFMDHRSIGKKIMKIRPITLEGKQLEIMDSVKRNWMFAMGPFMLIPIIGWFIILPLMVIFVLVEIILTLTDKEGRRFGDKIAGTIVLESQD